MGRGTTLNVLDHMKLSSLQATMQQREAILNVVDHMKMPEDQMLVDHMKMPEDKSFDEIIITDQGGKTLLGVDWPDLDALSDDEPWDLGPSTPMPLTFGDLVDLDNPQMSCNEASISPRSGFKLGQAVKCVGG